MKYVRTLWKVLLFLLILESAFAIHEYGHLREFQKRDVPIKEFSLGIGPLVYQYQTDSSLMAISFRLIPIMAYVAPTEKGGAQFKKEGSLRDRIAVDVAGVRNNFLAGFLAILFLQVLGWKMGKLSLKELVITMATTPFKIVLRFVAFLIGCLTIGRVNIVERFLISTGGIDPPRHLKDFIFWNLTLGFFNLLPIAPLDGGHALEAVMHSAGIGVPEVPRLVTNILFGVLFAVANKQDMRLLKS